MKGNQYTKRRILKQNHILKSCRIRMYSNGRRAAPVRRVWPCVSLIGLDSSLLCWFNQILVSTTILSRSSLESFSFQKKNKLTNNNNNRPLNFHPHQIFNICTIIYKRECYYITNTPMLRLTPTFFSYIISLTKSGWWILIPQKHLNKS